MKGWKKIVMKKVFTIGLVLALLLALSAPAFALTPSEAAGAKLILSAPELEKSDADQTTNIYLYSDMALSVDTIGITFSTTASELEIGTATSPITGALCSNSAVNFSAASPVDLTYDDAAGGYLIATIPVTVKAGATGTFTVNFTMDVTDMASGADFDFYGNEPTSTTIKVTGIDPTPTADYTVTISDGVEGTAEVEIGDTVTMTVTVSGAAFNGMQGTVTYDTSLFDLKSVSGDAADDKDSTDAIELYTLNNTAYSNGAEVATLTFEAKAAGTGNFTVAATVGDFDDFKSKDAVDADPVNDSVKVKEPEPVKYTVTVESVEHATVEADKDEAAEGETVTITANAASGWQIDSVGAVDATGAEVTVTDNKDGTYTVTMPASNITVTAAVSEIPAAKYEVELPTTVENATVTADKTEAAEGDEVVITVNPDEGYQVEEVTVKDGDGNTVAVTDNKDGTYTVIMPASKITVSVSVSEIPPAFTVKVTEYVTGINLVLVTGDAAGYTYNGQAMYDASAKYGEKVFAYLDETEGLTDAAAAALVKEATATAADHVLAAKSYEVNGTSKVDFNDAGAAFGCYNTAYALADNLAMYLRADVNADKTVDGSDVSAIMDNYS